MADQTPSQMAHTLANPPEPRRRGFLFGMGKKPPPSDPRLDLLLSMVIDLMMEVEALRAALLAMESGTPDAKAGYSRAYRDTAYLTHNSAGPSGGLDKLLGALDKPTTVIKSSLTPFSSAIVQIEGSK